MKYLNSTQINQLQENGFLVVERLVPESLCQEVVDAIFWFLEKDPHNSDEWYSPPLYPGGMIEMYQHQALWNTRQKSQVYDVFTDILGLNELCVSIDRVGMKPPRHPDYPDYDHKGFIHWDIDTRNLPPKPGIQGVLCLTDTSEDMGGFQCIPGFHKNLGQWIAEQPEDRNPFAPDLNRLPNGMKLTPIPAKAGDLILWYSTLAHGNGQNVSNRPRYSQYISMFPAKMLTSDQRDHRVNCWKNRLAPGNKIFPGDPRNFEAEFGTTAELTALGCKLLGAEAW